MFRASGHFRALLGMGFKPFPEGEKRLSFFNTYISASQPITKDAGRSTFPRLALSGRGLFQPIQVVGPLLHHFFALG